jgi:hypothetical protein
MFTKWKLIQKHMDLFEKMGEKIQTITINIVIIKTLTTRRKKHINIHKQWHKDTYIEA